MKIRERRRSVFAVVTLTALIAPLFALFAPSVGADSSYPLRTIGTMPTPKGPAKSPDSQAKVLGIDVKRRRLFYLYGDIDKKAWLVTYDISARVPRQLSLSPMGTFSDYDIATQYTVAYDTTRRQLAILTPTVDGGAAGSLPTGTPSLIVYSDVTHGILHRWNLTTSLPGYVAMGLTYSKRDDRYYAIGEFTGHQNIADGTPVAGGKFLSPGTGVVALDPTTGALDWVRSVAKECPQVLYSKSIGSLIAPSGIGEMLYFPCVSGGSPGGQTYPGTTGLVRLHIVPNGSSADQLNQQVEYYAISGSFFAGGTGSGIAAFDAVNERFYLQSLSFTTPGDWVFDGRLTAWVGFVSAPNNADYYIGMNQRMGHLYIGTRRSGDASTNGIQVADVHQTPVPNGDISSLVTTSLITGDDGSNRLFVRPVDTNAHWLILEDMTPVTTPGDTNEDYDAQTSLLPDAAPNDVDYAAGATGFGAEAVQVGGTGAPLTSIGSAGSGGIPGVAPGTRAEVSARVGAIDLRPSGAAASAQSVLGDSNTVQDWETQDHDGDGKPDKWPFPGITCLDAGGVPQQKAAHGPQQSGDDATASISCDLGKNVVVAHSEMSASGAGSMNANHTTYDVTATRDTKNGVQVTTTAVAHGVTFLAAGGFTVTFGRVSATSLSVAHGHPGTAKAEWTRDVEGVRITNSLGQDIPVVSGCSSSVKVSSGGKPVVQDTCAQLASALNSALPTRFHAEFPIPSVIATPKGAFAAVEQTDSQYFQQQTANDQGVIYPGDSVGVRPAPAVITETYSDTAERSRTVSVIAATQSNATFTVAPPFDDSFTDNGGGGGGNGGGNGDTTLPGITPGQTTGGSTGGQTPTTTTTGTGTAANPVTNLSGYLFMRRGLRDTALLVLLSGLMLGGCGTAWRRRRLVDVLVTVPRKEAL